MRIGINCLDLRSDYVGGLKTYTFGILDAFARIGIEYEFQIYANSENEHLFDGYKKLTNFKIIVCDISLTKKKIVWRTFRLGWMQLYHLIRNYTYQFVTDIIDENSDILYIPLTNLFTYNNKIPTVLSMHDIQQVHFPEFFTKLELKNRKINYELSARNSNYIQASSNYIKNDLLKHFPFMKEGRVIVIPEGVDTQKFGRGGDCTYLNEKYNLPEKFLFYPAQLWYHKNHITVLKALKVLKNRGKQVSLVLTGSQYSSSKEIFEYIRLNNLNEQVLYLGLIPFEDIIALYKRATYLITASLHESSCLPVLEAAASGIPIIASSIPPNEEMSENLKLKLFSPLDYASLADLIENIWEKKNINEDNVKYNLENIFVYSWDNIAIKYFELFNRINHN